MSEESEASELDGQVAMFRTFGQKALNSMSELQSPVVLLVLDQETGTIHVMNNIKAMKQVPVEIKSAFIAALATEFGVSL